jgi:hypothetical protein
MTMPKASMSEHGDLRRREYNIGRAWQISPLKTKAIAEAEDRPSHRQFRCGVF